MTQGISPTGGVKSFSEWKESDASPTPQQFLASLRMHRDTKTDFDFGDASDQLGEPGLELDLETRAGVVNCCIDILKGGMERGNSSPDAIYLLSSTLANPEDDLTIDPELLSKIDITKVKEGLQSAISTAKEEAFNPQLERQARDAWNSTGQLALDTLKGLPEGGLADLSTPQW